MSTAAIHIIGIDLGKNWFHLVGMNEKGDVLLRKKLNRNQLAEFVATSMTCIVAMESCPGSQYWGRLIPECWLYRTHHSGPIC
jgi:transposase